MFVSGSSVLCPETNEAGQRKLYLQEVNVKSNKKSTGQATSPGLIKILLTTIIQKELLVDKIIQALLSVTNSEASEHHRGLRVW